MAPEVLTLAGAAPLGVAIQGRLIGLLSFDVGYEIDLERARHLTTESAAADLERRRAAPPYLGYTTPPLRIPLGSHRLPVAGQQVEGIAVASIHDFGVVTIAVNVHLAGDVAGLPALTASLTDAGPLEDAGRRLVETLLERLRPAITTPRLHPFVEDYYVVQVDTLTPAMSIPAFVARTRGVLASTLRCEASVLSDAETDDALRTALSYFPDDLVLTDWNVAVVVDDEWTDTVNVIEYLNAQLLELRVFDTLLDRRVGEMYGRTAALIRPRLRHYLAYRRLLEELASIRLDVSTIIERVDNALKLSGDLYLAKVYARTAERLGLRSWETSVAAKLQVLQDISSILVGWVTAARAEALEVTIVVLIAIELVVLLAGWG